SSEPPLPWAAERTGDDLLFAGTGSPRLITDLETFAAEVGRRVQAAMVPYYPRNPDRSYPWGYLWAISIPCDGCGRRFPLLGSLVLRHPYSKTADPGQAVRLVIDGDDWHAEVIDGRPDQPPTYSSA